MIKRGHKTNMRGGGGVTWKCDATISRIDRRTASVFLTWMITHLVLVASVCVQPPPPTLFPYPLPPVNNAACYFQC